MGTFKRTFRVDQLADHRQNCGLDALFDRWVLPGADAGPYGLRVAIRNGYLNFYVKGQSVGELKLAAGSTRLRLHRKYKALARSGSPEAAELGAKYDVVDADDLATIDPGVIDSWIRTAETYAGDEKRFVDDLVAVTPGTLDLEMGLPADHGAKGKDRSAPRMDMVVAQGRDIAFWEAKCVVNSELRSRVAYKELPDGSYGQGPHVLWQLRRYERWVSRPHRLRQVRDAYVETARILLELAEMLGKVGQTVDAWRELVAAGENASVVLPPGIVVAEYCPTRADGQPRVESAVYAAAAKSFGKHEDRLVCHGTTLVKAGAKALSTTLPYLRSGSISALEVQPQLSSG